MERINGKFNFVKINYKEKETLEPISGIISYNDNLLYFDYHRDYIEGNIYVVYDHKHEPIFDFTLSYPYINPDNGNPVYDPDEFFEDDRDFENGKFKQWHKDGMS